MKKVLILFTDEWISYSPTILNFISILKDDTKLYLLTFTDGRYAIDHSGLPENTTLINIPMFLAYTLRLLGILDYLKTSVINHHLGLNIFDEIIAVDKLALECTLNSSSRVHYLSLEIIKDNIYSVICHDNLASVVIQTKERYEYLFGTRQFKTFFIQNAPVQSVPCISRHLSKPIKLIFLGNLIPLHGLYHAIEALLNSDRYVLNLKGRIKKRDHFKIKHQYKELINNGKLIIDTEYIAQELLIDYLASFDIGLCLYDLKILSKHDFNYYSIPSGKMFNYFAAGLPVITSDILGTNPVRQFNAGVMISDLSADNINSAVDMIINQYTLFSENSYQAADHYNFIKASTPFKNFIIEY